jgi:hypothetical protein
MIQVNNGSPHEIVTCEYDNIIVDNESLIVEKNNKFGILIPLVNWLQHAIMNRLKKYCLKLF